MHLMLHSPSEEQVKSWSDEIREFAFGFFHFITFSSIVHACASIFFLVQAILAQKIYFPGLIAYGENLLKNYSNNDPLSSALHSLLSSLVYLKET